MKARFCTVLLLSAALSGLALPTAVAAPVRPTKAAAKGAPHPPVAKAATAQPCLARSLGATIPDIPYCCQANCEGCGADGGGGCTAVACTSCICGCGISYGQQVAKCCCYHGSVPSCTTVTCG